MTFGITKFTSLPEPCIMTESTLIPYWIKSPSDQFGVTAFSLTDALRILEDAGYSLPQDRTTLRVTERVRISDLDQSHIVPNIGPMVVRGIWYPFMKVGV